jgi:Colicin V production protein
MVAAAEIQGSAQWQTVVIIAASIWLLLSVIRGWSKGLFRQILAILAIIGAAFLGLLFAGPLSAFLRTRTNLPGFVLGIVSAFLIGVFAYYLIIFLGSFFLKRTRDQESDLLRLICGSGGAIVGFLSGLFFIWAFLLGVRVLGRVAENQVAIEASRSEEPAFWSLNAVKLKNSVELGFGRALLDALDPLPLTFYRAIDLYSRIAGNPQLMQRVLLYPGFRPLWENPKINRLMHDPELVAAVRNGNIFEVMGNPKVVSLWNDPEIRACLSREKIEEAIRYAGGEGVVQ